MKQPLKPWLTIVGIGDDGIATLTPQAIELVKQTETLVAPERVLENLDLAALGLTEAEIVPWTMGVGPTLKFLEERRGRPVTILATGDPMHFGIGATMRRKLAPEEMQVIPSPSGFSLAAARLGWSLSDAACISLHGRAVVGVHPHILPENRIVSLTSVARTIHEVADILVARGYGRSVMTVLEHMGGNRERTVKITAEEVGPYHPDNPKFADFNVLGVECVAGEDAALYSAVPGLPDEAFFHDGQLTKSEVRAATLAALKPCPLALLWDVGAGCGSIAIEWMRAARGAKAFAVEAKRERVRMIADNAAALGTPRIKVFTGEAPAALQDLDRPDAVFIGGGVTDEGVFETCWEALKPGGRLVANVVTIEGETRLAHLHGDHGGTMRRIAVSRLEKVGGFSGWKPLMPVTQWAVDKPLESE
ncbi:precorrin-6y C5,15-methyltransferase (decarboxylating) subunit CbiE [Hoeflea sp. CAU 1731]